MHKLKDYLCDEKYIKLNSVNYINHNDSLETDVSLNCEDEMEFKYHNYSIEIVVTRCVDFKPKSLFEIKISYSIIHNIDEKYHGNFKIDDFNLHEEINSDLEYFVPNEMDRVSLIISQITDSFEGRPLITPPQFIFKNNK